MERILIAAGIKYEEQKHLRGIGIADFFLPEYNIAIEVDGIWWHSLESNRANDKRKNEAYAEAGIFLIRFTDRLVNEIFKEQTSV